MNVVGFSFHSSKTTRNFLQSAADAAASSFIPARSSCLQLSIASFQ